MKIPVGPPISTLETPKLKNEQSRRLIKQPADEINALLADDNITACAMAASAPIAKDAYDVCTGSYTIRWLDAC